MRSATGPSATEEIREQQLNRLRAGLTATLATNAFWRERLHGVSGWDDFERLPLTTKSELLADQTAHPPFGTNLTHPVDRYVRLHQTSGSSGDQPLRWLDTEESWDWWLRTWADHVYPAAGVTAAD
ncbi:MAG TPA: phenylacetate--CoA ligase family protein, partial [Candidatus Dormibacteraeota bacterium]|nr:phenylacetate--CoA ligase family protein [Candidatus Dormibacteraeota bacterium]